MNQNIYKHEKINKIIISVNINNNITLTETNKYIYMWEHFPN